MVKLFILICVIFLPMSSYADSYEEYFKENLHIIENRLKSEFPGPLGSDLAKVALARQVLEDGVTRRRGESCAGISVGGFNTEIVNQVIGRDNIHKSSIFDSEGGRFYFFKGHFVNIYSAHVIAKLFDFYVYKFIPKSKVTWIKSKELSKAIHLDPDSLELNIKYHSLNPSKIILKCNQLYGPQSGSVEMMIQK